MQAQSSAPVRTFTIGTASAAFDESAHAREVAAHLGTEHTELHASPQDALDVIPALADIYDEPFADSSQIPTYLVSRLARPHVTVALSGDGGDEVFGGYTRYVWGERLWTRASRLPPLLRRVGAASLGVVPTATIDRLYEKAEPMVPARWRQRHVGEKLQKVSRALGAASSGALYRSLVSLWDDPSALARQGVEPRTVIDDDSLDAQIPRFAERMMILDLLTYLPDDILVKVDRASMAVSLETRAPLLDHRLVEWVWRLPLEYRSRDGVGKWLLRRLLAQHVPPALFDRPKSGFAVPIAEWLRGPLRPWADELLSESRLLG
jgi:asparagine synthase (glutamine-hydrolysing)